MTQAVSRILSEVEQLSPPERADLADRLVETLTAGIAPETEQAQVEEVRRRIAQVESGEVSLIPGEQALENVHRLSPQGELMADYGFHPDALLEYAETTSYYLREVSPQVAERFVAAVESAVESVVAATRSLAGCREAGYSALRT